MLHLWNTPSTEVLQNDSIPVNFANLSGHKSAITSLEWLSDSHSLVTSSADRTLGLWDITTGERVRKFTGHSLVVNDVRTFQGDGIVSVSDDQRACVWDARTKQAAKEIKIEYPLLAVCVGKREPNIVFFSGIDPTIYGYDLRDTSKPLIQIDTLHSDAITSLCLSNDDFTLISNSMDGTIRAYDSRPFESNQRIKPVIFDDAPAGEEHLLIRSKQFVRDGVPYVISGSCNKSSVILNMKTERLAHNFYGHEGTVIDVDVHPNEKVLVSGSTDGNLIVREF